ncbi:undecaprenyldiphospho-muramoylpentapeptide beta-N-acetylglucosaminyltransferase [Geitlerinema sp. PCC 7407]|uniref:undecaprenyldiphospho-muramoylpentapeptide beta-N-acetylglucosaminyltransferase n=1 Tax=Geitlerinema sp. PCC 7407 TaxID=1173025 RepID=UPI00029FBD55|nr:undecaprenyldiphospho-muramoylpentapeptide beta-N-acetylglucosaminyltransferase [Geitlerinema sp. PCC 7407]AFY67067.1 UDP-N-acetylglucosamine--N-acetylmuramyl-(pentapeptide) pyrophosphoryl-undecaprenol N-acetylglucosamine transferase [Geitlerinema sp. PCC 7407]
MSDATARPSHRSAPRLLVAASGTGGHLFPAIALAEQLSDYHIEWLGVPDRLETQLVPKQYPLHTIRVEGFQSRSIKAVKVLFRLISGIFQVRSLLKQGNFQGVVTTGGYIAGPAILAARSLGLPVILHESNALPGKVTRWLSPWCTKVALGFDTSSQYLPRAHTVCVGTPVRPDFLTPPSLNLPIPPEAFLIVVVGGSQGAVALNRLVRQVAPVWLEAGAWIVHLTGDSDPEADTLHHPRYLVMPFYPHMSALFHRANLALSRAGAGTLTELAVTQTPSILVPYPFAAEDHQAFNAAVFGAAGAGIVCRQGDLTPDLLRDKVLHLMNSPEVLAEMAQRCQDLAEPDSAAQLATLVRQTLAARA